MPNINIMATDIEQEVASAVNELQSVEFNQLTKLINNHDERAVIYNIQKMYNGYSIDLLENSVVVPARKKNVDHDTVDCIWVMLDDVDNIHDSHYFKGEYPVSIVCQVNTRLIKEYVRVKADTLGNLTYLQERYFARSYNNDPNENLKLEFVLVVSDQSLVNEIYDLDLQIPYTIAVYNFAEGGSVNVAYC